MKRLASLDILRGFDLFLLLFVGPVVSSLAAVSDAEWTNSLAYHFDHAAWDGLRMWDLVMPLFMFMAGVSMPFALRKEVKGAGIWRRILKRVVLLFLLGMVVQGGLLTLSWEHFTFYTNTLQAIGFGYGIAAICLLTLSVRMQVLTTLALLIIYAIPMMLVSDYTQEGNFANLVDATVLGRFRGDPSYTWVWSTLTFAATFGTSDSLQGTYEATNHPALSGIWTFTSRIGLPLGQLPPHQQTPMDFLNDARHGRLLLPTPGTLLLRHRRFRMEPWIGVAEVVRHECHCRLHDWRMHQLP